MVGFEHSWVDGTALGKYDGTSHNSGDGSTLET